ncbi:MAG: hypothetical protein DRI93_03255 [Aquificota bacterium]|nr:MAG: hypothetical protein DRJ03_14780 [Chloroflexota bacterium]RLD94924.1 MAG: hypothetical protein DRI93_03255 [Aquificota bacterium]
MPLDPNFLEYQRLVNIVSPLGWEALTYTIEGDYIVVTLKKKKITTPELEERRGELVSRPVGIVR